MRYRHRVLRRELLYEGYFRLERYRLRHERYRGDWTEEIEREVLVRRTDAVAVLPYDPQADAVVLVEQFRVGAIRTPRPWLVEIVAGVLDGGEREEQTARRELREEAGLEALALERVMGFFTTPGASTERVTLYAACVDSRTLSPLAGHAGEHEDIRVWSVPFEEAGEMLRADELDSAIPVVGLQWLALNRARLQDDWRALVPP